MDNVGRFQVLPHFSYCVEDQETRLVYTPAEMYHIYIPNILICADYMNEYPYTALWNVSMCECVGVRICAKACVHYVCACVCIHSLVQTAPPQIHHKGNCTH